MINFFVQLLLLLNKTLFNNLGLTIIVIGGFTRLAVWPLFKAQLKHTKLMSDLKPKLDEIKKKYKGDQKRQLAEQSKLLKSHGTNPLGGCLPIIVQTAVFILLYQVLFRLLKMNVNTQFLLWDLAKPDTTHIQQLPIALPGVLVILTAILTFVQSKMLLPPAATKPTLGRKGAGTQDFAEALQASSGQMVYLTPLIMLYFGTILASGLTLYWLVSTFFGIIQQYIIGGAGGLKPWLAKIPQRK